LSKKSRPTTAIALACIAALLLVSCPGLGIPDPPAVHGFRLQPVSLQLAPEFQAVELFTTDGDIRVVDSEDPLLVVTHSVTAHNRQEAEQRAKESTILQNVDAQGVLQLELELPPRTASTGSIWADYELHVPRGRRLRLRSISGSIDASQYQAKSVLARTRSGNIRLGTVTGHIEFTTQTGSVHVEGRFKTLQGSGGHNDLRIEHLGPGTEVDYHAAAGLVQLQIDADVPASIGFRTLTGHVRSDIPISKTRLETAEQPWNQFRISLQEESKGEPASAQILLRSGLLVLWQKKDA